MGGNGMGTTAGRAVVIVGLVLQAFALVTVVLRVLARRIRSLPLGLDDYLIMLATLIFIPSTILAVTTVIKGGVGLHMHEVTQEAREYALKSLIPLQCLYGFGGALVKTSFMALYYRIFGTKKSLRIAIYITFIIVWGWGLCTIFESFLLCHPIEYNYNPFRAGGGKCADRIAAYIAIGVINIVTDLMVMVLPVPYVLKLQLPIGRKVVLVATFGLGLFVTVVSIIRVQSLVSIDFADATATLSGPLLWSMVEQQAAVIAANLPVLRYIFATILPRAFKEPSGQNSDGDGYTITRSGVGRTSQSQIKNQKFRLSEISPGGSRTVVLEGMGEGVVKPEKARVSVGVRGGDGEGEREREAWPEDDRSGNGLLPEGVDIYREIRASWRS
ncbi:hypothetical protein BJY04DRAFT_222170 [Aspergillus karnatakaensis]|uniref:uncharacterized protein n=1 Tax=Aspergillus karnatakaensis TaxID=1810916 RepID=UPI003CCE200E